jgi:hypothetical protein
VGIGVCLAEELFGTAVDWVLAGTKRIGKGCPATKANLTVKLHHAAHVGGLAGVEVQIGLRGVSIGTVITVKQPEGHQRVEEVCRPSLMQTSAFAQLLAGQRPIGEGGEHAQFYGAEQCPRGPIGGGKLHESIRRLIGVRLRCLSGSAALVVSSLHRLAPVHRC